MRMWTERRELCAYLLMVEKSESTSFLFGCNLITKIVNKAYFFMDSAGNGPIKLSMRLKLCGCTGRARDQIHYGKCIERLETMTSITISICCNMKVKTFKGFVLH